MKLFQHQSDALERTKDLNRVAYYHDMGLGKTFTGAEKMMQLRGTVNLIICQKSKLDDWINHFITHYTGKPYLVELYDLTVKKDGEEFMRVCSTASDDNPCQYIGFINYELAWRRPSLLKLHIDTLMLDESSLIQNEKSKRSKFILKMNTENVILLSGTPCSGKYEKLWSQLHLLGWDIKKTTFWNHYVDYEWNRDQGFPICIIRGYKNVERLKKKMREYGCDFIQTDEVFDLPDQMETTINVRNSKEYIKFKKHSVIDIDDHHLVGDTTLTKMLYERMLCGALNPAKIEAFRNILESTEDRLIVFYSFNDELEKLKDIIREYTDHISEVNGSVKDLAAYEAFSDSVTLIQYQAGAKGLNLQKANKIVYFTPTQSAEDWMQSRKRIHRIGQNQTCFYWKLVCKNSIEEKIYKALERGENYTLALYEEEE